MALEREQLTRERLDYQHRFRQAESRIQQLEGQTALDAERLQTTHHELQQAREQRQQAEIENARLQQANRDLEERHKDRDAQIHSLEENTDMRATPWSTTDRPARNSVSRNNADTSRRYNNCN